MSLQPWQERVVEERAQLNDRLEKLRAFSNGPMHAKLDLIDQHLLLNQDVAMDMYLRVLDKRIARFSNGT